MLKGKFNSGCGVWGAEVIALGGQLYKRWVWGLGVITKADQCCEVSRR